MITIKTEKQIENMRFVCKLAKEILDELEEFIKPGITTKEIDDFAYNYIIKNNATPSFLGYEGYPASVCTSVNEEVVHGIPGKRILKDGDIVSVDIGAYKNNVHSDTARTYIVGTTTKEIEDLVNNTKKALYEGIKVIKPGIKLNEVCKSIEKVAKDNGYGVIRELTGHGVGEEMHEDPYIPNYSNKESEKITLEKGMTLAIEPMFSLKGREIFILEDGWTIITQDESVTAHFEHTVLVTENGYEIMTGE